MSASFDMKKTPVKERHNDLDAIGVRKLQGLVAEAGELIRLRPQLGRRTAFFVTLFAKR